MASLLPDLRTLARGTYLQCVARVKLLDDAIIRSNEPEEGSCPFCAQAKAA